MSRRIRRQSLDAKVPNDSNSKPTGGGQSDFDPRTIDAERPLLTQVVDDPVRQTP